VMNIQDLETKYKELGAQAYLSKA